MTRFNAKAVGENIGVTGFWVLIGISMIHFLTNRYAISLDGPQHLHNAYVLRDLVFGKGEVRDFYALNPCPVGYWTAQVLLSFFTLFLPSWLAEKTLLLLYVTGMAFAFRFFLKSFGVKLHPVAPWLIFPFISSYFIDLGYYAFSFGIIVLLITLAFWNRIRRKLNFSRTLVFALLLLFLYFTHGVVFSLFLVAFFILFLQDALSRIVESGNSRKAWIKELGRAGFTILAFSPALLMLWLYVSSVPISTSSIPMIPLHELLDRIMRISVIIGFHRELESAYTLPLFFSLLMVFLMVAIRSLSRLVSGKTNMGRILNDGSWGYLIVSIVFLFLYLFLQEKMPGGNMTSRLAYFFFLFFVIWLSIQLKSIPHIFGWFLGIVVFFAVIYNEALMPRLYSQNREIVEDIQEMDRYIKEGATVSNVNGGGAWLQGHFGLYAGLDKHTLNLQNPQCIGLFPLKWKQSNLTAFYMVDKQLHIYGIGRPDPEKHPSRQVDYLLVLFPEKFLEDESNADWKEVLEREEYRLLHMSSRRWAALYGRND